MKIENLEKINELAARLDNLSKQEKALVSAVTATIGPPRVIVSNLPFKFSYEFDLTMDVYDIVLRKIREEMFILKSELQGLGIDLPNCN